MTVANFTEQHWSIPTKWLFRFIAAYLFWYIFPFPIREIPFIGEVTKFYQELTIALSIWVGENILNIEDPFNSQPTGSGDTLLSYAANFTVLIVAVLTTFIWSILDRNRPNYNRLLYWIEVLVRYYLGYFLMSYGFAKIIKTQFPFPSLNRLVQPFGEASPMGLAWTYMGYSNAFNVFTGLGEASAGFLLFFRRTKLIGLFIGIPVMLTIFMMNMSFDIPVKLFSGNLLLMLCLLLLPETKRLLNFFLLNQPVSPVPIITPIGNESLRKFGLFAKYSFIVYLLYSNISSGIERQHQWGDKRVKPPLYGIYTAEEVIINQDTIPPLITDQDRWHQLIIDQEKYASIKLMDGKMLYCDFITDTLTNTIDLKLRNGTMQVPSTFQYEKKGNYQLTIKGVLISGGANDTLSIRLQRKNLADFLLINRDFHWVNERPFNR